MARYQLPVARFESGLVSTSDIEEYKRFIKLNADLNQTREMMEEFMVEDKQLFKTVTSNPEPHKYIGNRIHEQFSSPNTVNQWVKIYEILSSYPDLIPEQFPEGKKFRFLDCDALPGNALLCTHHFMHTMRRPLIDRYEWSCSYTEQEDLQKDSYMLYQNYRDHFIEINLNEGAQSVCVCRVDQERVLEQAKADNYVIDYQEDVGITCNCEECKYCIAEEEEVTKKYNFNSYNLIIGTYEAISDNFRFQEQNDLEGIIHQMYVVLKYLSQGGSAVIRLTSFFDILTISMISLMTQCFESTEIFRPISAKKDSTEVFLICRNYRLKESKPIADFIGRSLDDRKFRNGHAITYGRLTGEIWEKLYDILQQITTSVRNKIISNIQIYRNLRDETKGDPNEMKKISREMGENSKDEALAQWYDSYPIEGLPDRYKLDIRDTILDVQYRGSGGRGHHDWRGGRGRGRGRGGGGGGGRGNHRNYHKDRKSDVDEEGWTKVR